VKHRAYKPKFFERLNDLVYPTTAFRMGVIWCQREKWMERAREERRLGNLHNMRMCVRVARENNAQLVIDLKLARVVKRHTRAAA
jgi:hypothetical protein